MADPVAADSGSEPILDIASAVADIGDSLGFNEPAEDTEDTPSGEQTELELEAQPSGDETHDPVTTTVSDPSAAAPPTTATVREMPKSWAKDKEPIWKALAPDAQEYYELREKQFLDGLDQYKGDAGVAKQFREVVAPYKAMLQAQGISETQAVQYLLNAQYRMSHGTQEERSAAYAEVGRSLGLVAPQAAAEEQNVDPAIRGLREELNGVKSVLSQREEAEKASVLADANASVSKFASDPANLYFSDVAQDMLPFVKAGLSLPDAYEKAVWANPATRAKEMARLQTEGDAKQAEAKRLEADAAKRATAVNVRSKETRTAPTEPLGSLDDTLRSTLRTIKGRAH